MVYGWENERGKGRPLYKKRQITLEWPQIFRVYCQQFFKNGLKQGFFEVIREEAVDERDLELDIQVKVQKITVERLEHIEKKAKEKVKEANENVEPNLQLKQVGWVRHLKEKDPKQLQEAIVLLNTSKKLKLQAIIKSFS